MAGQRMRVKGSKDWRRKAEAVEAAFMRGVEHPQQPDPPPKKQPPGREEWSNTIGDELRAKWEAVKQEQAAQNPLGWIELAARELERLLREDCAAKGRIDQRPDSKYRKVKNRYYAWRDEVESWQLPPHVQEFVAQHKVWGRDSRTGRQWLTLESLRGAVYRATYQAADALLDKNHVMRQMMETTRG